ncbi:hypothetical protein DIPPA_09835 [Diplonema papillatum]|nr:hypothetical protein DIPPA_09835 [Diplonema papillatum]
MAACCASVVMELPLERALGERACGPEPGDSVALLDGSGAAAAGSGLCGCTSTRTVKSSPQGLRSIEGIPQGITNEL